jgi:hypothetical protein
LIGLLTLLLAECEVAFVQPSCSFQNNDLFQLTSWKTYNQSCSIYILLYLNIDKTGLKYTGFIISYCQAHTMRTQPLLFFYRKKRINDKEFTLLQYFWASTALAIFITMPMVASMLYFHFNYNNLLFGTLVGFSVHTAVLVFSKRLSSLLLNLVSIWLALLTQGKNISFLYIDTYTKEVVDYILW